MIVDVMEGGRVLDRLGAQMDDLHRVTGVPLTARRTWLQTWFDCRPGCRPVAVVVGRPQRLDAAAVLAVDRRSRRADVMAAGQGPSDVAALPARDPAAADQLAGGIVEWLSDQGRWRLTLRQLRPEDGARDRLAQTLRHDTVRPGQICPVLRAQPGDSLQDHVSRGHWRKHRKELNRMRRSGLEPEVRHLRQPAEIAAAMAEIESVLRSRDLAPGRRSILDAVGSRFFRLVIERHALRGEVCVTTLRLSGGLASYALCFVDEGAYRLWNSGFDPAFSEFGVGRLTRDEAVAHALEQGATEFDFMRGEEPHKGSYANARVSPVDLFAWSSGLAAAGGRARLAARDVAVRAERSGGAGGHLVEVLRRTARRVTPRSESES